MFKSCDAKLSKGPSGGFSLVEVTLALGIIAFCLVSLLGLMPVGLDSIRNANREAEASMLLRQISTSLMAPVREENGSYTLPDPGTLGNIIWTPGGSPQLWSGFVRASGEGAADAADADFVWQLKITPPANRWSQGQALVRLAWPATATWENGAWQHEQGKVRALVFFRP